MRTLFTAKDLDHLSDSQKLAFANDLIDQVMNKSTQKKSNQIISHYEALLRNEYEEKTSFTFSPMEGFEASLSNSDHLKNIKNELTSLKASLS
jgi:hypothetical protein